MKYFKEKKNNPDYVPFWEKVGYGATEIYGGGSAIIISVCLLAFMNKSLGIPSAIAGLIVWIARAWDAVSDPLMGIISDNTRHKFGRRKPYMIIGGILTFFAMMFLFAPINKFSLNTKIALAGLAYIFFCTSNTVSQVPYCSLSSEISNDHNERNDANTIKLLFSLGAGGLCFFVAPALIDALVKKDNKFFGHSFSITPTQFFLAIGVGFGILFALVLILGGIFSKERVPYMENPKTKFHIKAYIRPFKVKSFRWHLGMYITAFVCMDIVSALAAFYAADVMRGRDVDTIFIIAPMMVCAGLMMPLIIYISRKKSKQFAYRVGLPFYVLGGLMLAFMPKTAPVFMIILASVIMGIGFGGAQSMPWIIFPDTIDVAELKYGKREVGTFSGIMTFCRKLANAFAIGIVGLILTLSHQITPKEGQDPKSIIQPASVISAIRITLGVSIVLLIILGFYSSMKYKVTPNKMHRIKHFLKKQRENQVLTVEEMIEKETLIDELGGK